MSTRKTSQIKNSLTSKGFKPEYTHHEMFWLYVDDKRTGIRTRISHGKNEYGDNLLGQMARQIKLKRAELDDLIDCPLTGEAYLTILKDKDFL